MKNLEKEIQAIKNGGLWSFATIDDFGWGSHIDQSKGGLVVYMKTGKTVVMNQNEAGLYYAYDYDLTEQERQDIEYLTNWITE